MVQGDARLRRRQPQGRNRRIRIAYLAHGVDGRRGGIRRKILTQASTWAELEPTLEVGIFVRCEAGVEQDWIAEPNVVSARSSRTGIVGRLIQRELLTVDLGRWRPDFVYLRQGTVSPSIVVLVAATPTVVELNTLDLAELRIQSRLRYLYALATRGLVLRRARALVAVTAEIAEHPSVQRLRRPTAIVPNAIDLSRYRPLPATGNVWPSLVFLGSPSLPWHGIRQIVALARHFPTWTFDVIGPGPDEVADDVANIRLHGPLDPVDYLPILARADVAIGPLALHRKRMQEASPLKVAEYLACGLPAIIGYTDTRFPSGAPFLLQLPNSDDSIEASVDRIESFVRSWMGRRVDRAALGSIDARIVERRRLDFMLASLAGARPSTVHAPGSPIKGAGARKGTSR